MRKFTKIFSVVLVLCLLCGALAISVFAAETDTETGMLNPGTDYAWNFREDYTGASGWGTYAGGSVSGVGFRSWSNSTNYGQYSVKTDASGNSYLSISRKDNATAWSSGSSYITVGTAYTAWNGFKSTPNPFPTNSYIPADTTVNVKGTEYTGTQLAAMVVDFDFGSNQYAWEVNGTTYMGTEPPAEAENVRLALDALADGAAYFCLNFRSPDIEADGTVKSSGGTSYGWAGFYCENGEWYIAASTGNQTTGLRKSTAIKLTNEIGKFDHITIVTTPSTVSGQAKVEYFVNGQSLGYQSTVGVANNTSRPYVFCDELRLTFNSTNCLLPFDYMFDNVSWNYYPVTYDADYATDGVYNLRDYIADTSADKKLYNCGDVVYNTSYVTPGAGVVTVGSQSSAFPAHYNTILASLTDGGTIKLQGATVTGFVPPAEVKSFSVELDENSTFSLDDSVANNFVRSESSGKIVFSEPSAATQVTLKWLDANGGLITETILNLGNTPEAPVTLTGTANFGTNGIGGSASSFLGWEWDPQGTGTNSALSALTQADIDAAVLNDITGGTGTGTDPFINVTPKFSEPTTGLNFAFGIYDADGNGYIPAGLDYTVAQSISKIKTALQNAESGTTIKLFDDNTDGKLKLTAAIGDFAKAGFEYTIDFNGLTVYYYTTGQYGGDFITVSAENVTLNIINGSFFFSRYNSAGAGNNIFGAGGLVNVPGSIDTFTLNLGTPDGLKPINFYGGSVIYTGSTTSLATYGNGKIATNVYGGTYLNSARSAYFMFGVISPDNVITVRGAKLINMEDADYGIFGNYPSYKTDGQEIYCYDTTLVAMKTDCKTTTNLIFAGNRDSFKAYFEGCTIIADAVSMGGATVTLGANNYVGGTIANNFTAPATGYSLGENVKTLNAGLAKTVSFDIPKEFRRGFTGYDLSDINNAIYTISNVAFNYTLNLISYDETKPLPEGVVEVTFKLDESNSEKQYYLVGATVSGNPTSFTLPAAEVKNNGWFDLGYAWENESDKSLVVKESGNVFVPTKRVPVANLTVAKMNVSLWTHFGMNLYIPSKDEALKVTFDGFYENGSKLSTGNQSSRYIDGVRYDSDTWYPTITNFSAVTRVVKYNVEYEGTVYLLEATFKHSQLDYANAVVDSGKFACGSDDLRVVYDMIKYKDTVATYYNSSAVTATIRSALDAFYAKFDAHENCTCGTDLENITFSEEELAINAASYAELTNAAYGVSYTLADKPVLSVYVKPLAEGQTVKVTATSTNINGLTAGYGRLDKSAGTADTFGGDAEKTCTRYDFVSIYACDVNTIVTITITISEDGAADQVYTGQYCLAEYIESLEDGSAVETAAKTFWAYSKSAYDFKVVPKSE